MTSTTRATRLILGLTTMGFILSFSVEAQDYRRDGQGVRTKRWTGEKVSEVVRVNANSERTFEFEMSTDEYEFKFQLVTEETGYFRPGCDWNFRHKYDPRWDVYHEIPRHHHRRRAQALSELIDGVDYQMALVIVEDGRFERRPENFNQYQDELKPYYLSNWVMHPDRYHDNLVRMGAIRPGWEIECGGQFVHIAYDKLVSKKTKTGNTLEQTVRLDIEGRPRFISDDEEDRFHIYFDGHTAWARVDSSNSNRYKIEALEDDPFHFVAEYKSRNRISNSWDQRYADSDLYFDWDSESLVLEFEDKAEADHDTIVYVTLKQINRFRNSSILDEEPVYVQRDIASVGNRYLIDLEELTRNNGKRLQAGKKYYAYVQFKRTRSNFFLDNTSTQKRIPSSGGVEFER